MVGLEHRVVAAWCSATRAPLVIMQIAPLHGRRVKQAIATISLTWTRPSMIYMDAQGLRHEVYRSWSYRLTCEVPACWSCAVEWTGRASLLAT